MLSHTQCLVLFIRTLVCFSVRRGLFVKVRMQQSDSVSVVGICRYEPLNWARGQSCSTAEVWCVQEIWTGEHKRAKREHVAQKALNLELRCHIYVKMWTVRFLRKLGKSILFPCCRISERWLKGFPVISAGHTTQPMPFPTFGCIFLTQNNNSVKQIFLTLLNNNEPLSTSGLTAQLVLRAQQDKPIHSTIL